MPAVADLLALGALALGALFGQAPDGTPEGVRASWGPTVLEAEIGEPVTWTLEVAHPRRERPTLLTTDLAGELDRTWAFVSGPEIRTRPDEREREAEITSYTWVLMALEPGERAAPPLSLSTASGEELEVSADALGVRAALAPDEDAPRPLAPFHELDSEARPSGLAFLFAVLALLALLASPFVVRAIRARRRARLAMPEPIPSPRASFDALVADRADDPDSVRALAFGLTDVVRRAFAEAGIAVELRGATDEEWIEAVRVKGAAAGIDAATLERTADVMAACESIKYGGDVPTRFAIDELVGHARAVLDGVSAAGPAGLPTLEAVG